MCRLPSPCRRGISLVEVLVSLAIVALLCALTANTLSRSKRNAYRAEATAYGRQIGLAHAMYAEDNNSRQLYTAIPLLAAGYVAAPVLAYRDDPFAGGAACAARQLSYGHPSLTRVDLCSPGLKISWIGPADFAYDEEIIRAALRHPDSGPLALVIERGDQRVKAPYFHAQISPCGKDVAILRLRFDTSVVRRPRPLTAFSEGGTSYSACRVLNTFTEGW